MNAADYRDALAGWNRRVAEANKRIGVLCDRKVCLDVMLPRETPGSARMRRVVRLLLRLDDLESEALRERDFAIDERWKVQRRLFAAEAAMREGALA